MSPALPEGARVRRLMVVDDSKLVLQIVADFFSPHGYEVLQAENAWRALDLLELSPPDVIVSDIQMPEMDGWAFYEEARRRPEGTDVPFVFLTVEAELPSRIRGLHLGADDYVTKPFEVEELHARIERILERRDALEHARQGMDAFLSGSVEHLAISDLLQILSLNGKDAVVRLRQGDREGFVVFDEGQIVHAACDRARGAKALYRMLGWSTASFRVLPPPGSATERTVTGPATGVLMDGLVSLDEWNRLKDLIPRPGAVLTITPDARTRLAGRPVTPAEFDVLARTRSGATVEDVLEESPLPDALLAEAIAGLLDRRVIAVER